MPLASLQHVRQWLGSRVWSGGCRADELFAEKLDVMLALDDKWHRGRRQFVLILVCVAPNGSRWSTLFPLLVPHRGEPRLPRPPRQPVDCVENGFAVPRSA